MFAEWCTLADEGRGKQGRRATLCRCQTPFLAALVSPFTPTVHRTIPPTPGGGTSTKSPRHCEQRNLLLARAPNHIVASFQVANHYPHTHRAHHSADVRRRNLHRTPWHCEKRYLHTPHGIANNGTSISCEIPLRKLTIQKSIVKLRCGFY